MTAPAAITVEVALPGVLVEDAGGVDTVDVQVAPPASGEAASVRHVLDGLAVMHPRLGRRLRDELGAVRRHVNLFVDGDDIRTTGGQSTPVSHGSTLYVLPNVAGG